MRIISFLNLPLHLLYSYYYLVPVSLIVPALHGGVTASILEHTSKYAASTVVPSHDTKIYTSDIVIDYLKIGPILGHMICEGVVKQASSKVIRVDSVCWDETMTTQIATGRATFVLR